MVMGLKKTSEILNIGGSGTQSGVDVFTTIEQTLPLSSLDREVFVVTDAWIELPNMAPVAGVSVSVDVSITKTDVGALGTINDPALIARKNCNLLGQVAGTLGVWEDRFPGDASTTGTPRDYLSVIATPNFFVNVNTNQTGNANTAAVRLQGYRAKATADLYAALVTEEINS